MDDCCNRCSNNCGCGGFFGSQNIWIIIGAIVIIWLLFANDDNNCGCGCDHSCC